MTDEQMNTHVHDDADCPVCRRREEAELARLKAAQNKWVIRCKMVADCMDRMRLIPRVIILAYGWLFYLVFSWFMALAERTTADAIALSALTGVAGLIISAYYNTGNKPKD